MQNLNNYSQNINDSAAYLSPFFTMVATALTGEVNHVSTLVSLGINELGEKLSRKLENNKDKIDRSFSMLCGVAGMTAVNLSGVLDRIPQLSKNIGLKTLCHFGLNLAAFAASYNILQTVSPSKLLPLIRIPATVGISYLAGDIIKRILPTDVNNHLSNISGLSSLIFLGIFAGRDLFQKNPNTLTVGNQTVKKLSNGYLLISPKRK